MEVKISELKRIFMIDIFSFFPVFAMLKLIKITIT